MRDARPCLIMQNNVGLRRHTGHGCDGRASVSTQTWEPFTFLDKNVGEWVKSERSLSAKTK